MRRMCWPVPSPPISWPSSAPTCSRSSRRPIPTARAGAGRTMPRTRRAWASTTRSRAATSGPSPSTSAARRGGTSCWRSSAERDVFVENYATGALDALGIGYDALTAVNPALVHCSITGYGDTGPRAAQGAYDNLIQAGAGVIDQSGGHKPGVSFVDYATGYAAAFAILAAVVQRGRTGRGLPRLLLDVRGRHVADGAGGGGRSGSPPPPIRPREAGIVAYETADGRLMPGAFKPAQYGKLAVCLAAAGHDVPGLADIREWPDVWRLSDALRPRLAEVLPHPDERGLGRAPSCRRPAGGPGQAARRGRRGPAAGRAGLLPPEPPMRPTPCCPARPSP